VVERTADEVFVPLTVGGGIAHPGGRRRHPAGGGGQGLGEQLGGDQPRAHRGGGRAIAYGRQALVVAIDARWRATRTTRARAGGCSPTAAGWTPGSTPLAWAREVDRRGAGEILLTSMDRDGTGLGYDLELVRAVVEAVGCPVIAWSRPSDHPASDHDVLATHYCAQGNQPRLRATAGASADVTFRIADITGLDPDEAHLVELTLRDLTPDAFTRVETYAAPDGTTEVTTYAFRRTPATPAPAQSPGAI
jgi:hypothetical protein